ncbi:homoserine kinase [Ruminococcaceae bacterium OttesenSCG-928-I18]|nr:homoserine kinase [Ruminococcaceae bacterium OttesenSCG-928-I18]
MVTVQVPATSANVGAGFDTLGLAVGLYNTVVMEEAEGCDIAPMDEVEVPRGEDNIVYRSAKRLYEECGKPFHGLALRQSSPIPIARGLGSSSACIVAGLIGANALLKNPCQRQDLLCLAAGMEGHPDNIAPALLGGLVVSCIQEGKVYSVKKEISPMLEFGVFIPDYELPTEKARAVLPKTVPFEDALFNLSRVGLCQAALCEGRLDLLSVVTQDRLHQASRLALMPGGEEVFALAREAGARAVCVSGAGPSVLAVVEESREAFWPRAEQNLQRRREQNSEAGRFRLYRYKPDNFGARLI